MMVKYKNVNSQMVCWTIFQTIPVRMCLGPGRECRYGDLGIPGIPGLVEGRATCHQDYIQMSIFTFDEQTGRRADEESVKVPAGCYCAVSQEKEKVTIPHHILPSKLVKVVSFAVSILIIIDSQK